MISSKKTELSFAVSKCSTGKARCSWDKTWYLQFFALFFKFLYTNLNQTTKLLILTGIYFPIVCFTSGHSSISYPFPILFSSFFYTNPSQKTEPWKRVFFFARHLFQNVKIIPNIANEAVHNLPKIFIIFPSHGAINADLTQ